ncbi:MAG: transposase [Segetibacter sp.]
MESLKYRQQEKGLTINGWIIMSNHVHLIARSKPDFQLADTMRDLKKLQVKR